MSCFAGLDISMALTAVCIVDGDGAVVSEATVDSTPEAVTGFLDGAGVTIERIGLEACPLSEWIFESLAGRRVSGGLSGDAPSSGVAEERDQQDRPQRCARHCPGGSGQAVQAQCT